MSNNEQLPEEVSPETIDFDKNAQTMILGLEAACLALESGEPIVENVEFIRLYEILQTNLQELAGARGGQDVSVWFNYYLTQTFGILSLIFPEIADDFESSYSELVYLTDNLSDEELKQTWGTKIAQMRG